MLALPGATHFQKVYIKTLKFRCEYWRIERKEPRAAPEQPRVIHYYSSRKRRNREEGAQSKPEQPQSSREMFSTLRVREEIERKEPRATPEQRDELSYENRRSGSGSPNREPRALPELSRAYLSLTCNKELQRKQYARHCPEWSRAAQRPKRIRSEPLGNDFVDARGPLIFSYA